MCHRNRKQVPLALALAGSAFLLFSCGSNTETVSPAPRAGTEASMQTKEIRSSLAGSWYTAGAEQLGREVQGYLDSVSGEPLENVMALILPHAGYRFSGQTAAYGVKHVAGRTFSRVIVMGPSHRLPMMNSASLPDATHYSTPLGRVPLDTEFIARLKQHKMFTAVPAAFEDEHSVQIEVPLLQKALGEFRLVPIVVGQLDAAATKRMAEALLENIDPETLVVVSTDFTHYGPNYGYVPFRKDVFENLEKLDLGAYKFIEKKDSDGFADYIDETGATICGRCPVAVLLAMLPAEAEAHKLRYDTSGQLVGDPENSVSYLSVAFTGRWPAGSKRKPAQAEAAGARAEIPEADREALLRLARRTIEYYMDNGKAPEPADVGVEITPAMKQTMGAFVTLKQRGELRGCIGEIVPRRALYKAVIERAVDACVNDPRFPAVKKADVAGLDIEISALSPPEPVPSCNDIVIGRHGVVLQKRGRSAVFLPQVAPEQGWGLEETLTHLSTKAGLPPDAWKSDATFLVFEAIVFGEKEHGEP